MKQWLRVGFLVFLAAALPLAPPFVGQERQRPPRRERRLRFKPLYAPRFVPAAEADFLRDTDRVVGVSGNGVAKAYPVTAVAWHHIVHDRLGDLPILPTW